MVNEGENLTKEPMLLLIRQEMCCKRNIETPLPNYFCRGNSIMISYSECVSVALIIQHTVHVRHIVDCGLSDSTVFFHIIS
jgi:hypothetical protein